MTTSSADTSRTHSDSERTPAQWYSLIFGAILLVAGLLGFIADSSFDFGDGINGDDLVIFEVNGTHNLVHIASGALGLALAGKRETARAFALGFGAVYLLVTIIGLIDGSDVLGIIPVNGADNVLHILIAIAGIAAGLASSPRDSSRQRTA
jgi:Domain of unknown function (DUF4383)